MKAFLAAAALVVAPLALHAQQPSLGYYRFPSIFGETIVFTAEGDLWSVPVSGGTARRLTTHPSEESHPAISPDGKLVAFSASYEGPTEVYTMPIEGGPPTRHTFDGERATVVGWTPDGQILYATRHFIGLPSEQLAAVDPRTNAVHVVELAQASDGAFTAAGDLYFTRFEFQGSFTKRYQGGTAQNIWIYPRGAPASRPLTADYPGTSRSPMVWHDRVYFVTDRSGSMNLWSMDAQGKDLKQLTTHATFDVQSPALGGGRIVYQLGADLRVYDISTGVDTPVPIRLVSDFDQTRERWITRPATWASDAHLSPNGDRVAIVARGQLFVLPARQGRIVDVSHGAPVRFRMARFFPDGKTLLTLSDQSGEVEFWRLPATGVGDSKQLTTNASVLRWDGTASPDGRYVMHTDKDQRLWLLDLQTMKNTLIDANRVGDFGDVTWSPDSKWVAYAAPAANLFERLYLYGIDIGARIAVTSDRYDSYSPTWSPDGKWLYFLSDRNLVTSVEGPWGPRQPEPFFDRQTQIFAIALTKGARSPFQPDDELHPPASAAAASDSARGSRAGGSKEKSPPGAATKAEATKPANVRVMIDTSGIEQRLVLVPAPAGNYASLTTDGKRLYYIAAEGRLKPRKSLMALPIGNVGDTADVFFGNVARYELSLDRGKLLVQRDSDLFVFEAGAKAGTDLGKAQVALDGWEMHVDPRAEWRQMFVDAWRLERDYFYDHGMNGNDWTAVRKRYEPLVARVTDRAELRDLLAQMVGELSALHIFVYGGDDRHGSDNVLPASLGARVARDSTAGGFRVEHIFATDPDAPSELSPLARLGVDVREGDIIESIDGTSARSATSLGALLRGKAGTQVLLEVRGRDSHALRTVIVTPITPARERGMRYEEWEFLQRRAVEAASAGRIGYVHLRAMGASDMNQWERDFYPVFDRDGLIIDVRHNRGGNIDSWLLEKLLRKAWFYWQPRTGDPVWNMQYAFRGHVVVLMDEGTASDGEAFSEGFRRLGLGKLIGTRTWGGEIWLSSDNFLVDRGIATAAELGVYGPEQQWLIEGHGVDPDIVVDNEPHATFEGRDAQLDAAIKYLQEEIRAHPVPVPPAPAYPNKAVIRPASVPPR